jgi:hypothetical protein
MDEFKVYKIELIVTDPDINTAKIRWLLEEAGEINYIEVD